MENNETNEQPQSGNEKFNEFLDSNKKNLEDQIRKGLGDQASSIKDTLKDIKDVLGVNELDLTKEALDRLEEIGVEDYKEIEKAVMTSLTSNINTISDMKKRLVQEGKYGVAAKLRALELVMFPKLKEHDETYKRAQLLQKAFQMVGYDIPMKLCYIADQVCSMEDVGKEVNLDSAQDLLEKSTLIFRGE